MGKHFVFLILKSEKSTIDAAYPRRWVHIFKNGAFDSQPIAVQADILKDRIRRIVMRENGVYVKIFGSSHLVV